MSRASGPGPSLTNSGGFTSKWLPFTITNPTRRFPMLPVAHQIVQCREADWLGQAEPEHP
jgi:hypothetical protein